MAGVANELTLTGLPDDARGVLPSQLLAEAITLGHIDAGDYKIPTSSIQPASLDLRLGERAYRLRCSFLPDTEPVDLKMKPLIVDELDLRDDGAVLEPNRPYLIPLMERLELPPGIRAKANPKSSTGRLDVFTRVITDRSYRFDEILWRGVGAAGKVAGLRLDDVGLDAVATDGRQRTVKAGRARVEVVGDPGEVLLFVTGRADVAQVELRGPAASVAQVRDAQLRR